MNLNCDPELRYLIIIEVLLQKTCQDFTKANKKNVGLNEEPANLPVGTIASQELACSTCSQGSFSVAWFNEEWVLAAASTIVQKSLTRLFKNY